MLMTPLPGQSRVGATVGVGIRPKVTVTLMVSSTVMVSSTKLHGRCAVCYMLHGRCAILARFDSGKTENEEQVDCT